MRLRGWADFGRGILQADHLAASDKYYQWHAAQELEGDKGLYHVCQTARAEMLGRADHRELVHLHRWRMTCPLVMIENEQTRPMKAFPRTSLVRASPPLTSPAVRLLVRLLLLFLFSSLAFTPSAFCSSKVPTDPWRLSSTATPTPGPGAPGFNASASLLVHDTYRPCQTRRHRDCLPAQVPPV